MENPVDRSAIGKYVVFFNGCFAPRRDLYAYNHSLVDIAERVGISEADVQKILDERTQEPYFKTKKERSDCLEIWAHCTQG